MREFRRNGRWHIVLGKVRRYDSYAETVNIEAQPCDESNVSACRRLVEIIK